MSCTVGLQGEGDIVMVDDGSDDDEEGEGSKNWSFPLPAGDMYVLR